MDQSEKVANDKISKLESEIKVLKNEVQAVLLDLRESYLNVQNPFNSAASPAAVQPIIINQSNPASERKPDPPPPESQPPLSAELENDQPVESPPVAARKPARTSVPKKLEAASRSELDSPLAKPAEPAAIEKARLDLVVVAGLMGWVEESTSKIGKERTEAVLDISEAMGYIAGDLRPILKKLIALAPQPSSERPIVARDYIKSLIKINSMLGKDTREETALLLLSLASGDQNSG